MHRLPLFGTEQYCHIRLIGSPKGDLVEINRTRLCPRSAKSSVSVRSSCSDSSLSVLIVSTMYSGHLEGRCDGQEGSEDAVMVG